MALVQMALRPWPGVSIYVHRRDHGIYVEIDTVTGIPTLSVHQLSPELIYCSLISCAFCYDTENMDMG